MTLPNFLIVGAAKSGTTSLYHGLEQHPEVFMPKWKEPAYFVDDYPRRAQSLEEYRSIFRDAGGAKAVGEASTPYLYDSEAARKILETLGKIKIIMVLRNPVDIAYSLWGWMANRYGFEKLSFAEALEVEEGRMADPRFKESCIDWHASFYYFHRGLLAAQVKRYLDTFGRDHVLIHIFEDFVKDRDACRHTFSFLGVDPMFRPKIEQRNPASVPKSRLLQHLVANPPRFVQQVYEALPLGLRSRVYDSARFIHKLNLKPQARAAMEEGLRRELTARYTGDIQELEKLIGMNLSRWYRLG